MSWRPFISEDLLLTYVCHAAAYYGALLSYSIVVYKSIGLPQMNSLLPYVQRALMDDNVQYALLAAYWSISKPVYCEIDWVGGADCD